MKAHIYALGWHRNNCLKVILNSVNLRANIDHENSCQAAYVRLFTHSLQKTINEKYWLVIAAVMLRPISKNIFNHPCTPWELT